MQVIEHTIPQTTIEHLRIQATQKINAEGWAKQGRNVPVKISNFVNCWTTEEALKNILIENRAWLRYRGLYFGDAHGAGCDFTVRIDGIEVTLGLRSIAKKSVELYKSVAYPDDRIKKEQNKIADYIIACHNDEGKVTFFGAIQRQRFLDLLASAQRHYSKKNQEYFRTVPLEEFKIDVLQELIEKVEKV